MGGSSGGASKKDVKRSFGEGKTAITGREEEFRADEAYQLLKDLFTSIAAAPTARGADVLGKLGTRMAGPLHAQAEDRMRGDLHRLSLDGGNVRGGAGVEAVSDVHTDLAQALGQLETGLTMQQIQQFWTDIMNSANLNKMMWGQEDVYPQMLANLAAGQGNAMAGLAQATQANPSNPFGSLLGGAVGSFLGPLGAFAGAGLGNSLFNSGNRAGNNPSGPATVMRI